MDRLNWHTSPDPRAVPFIELLAALLKGQIKEAQLFKGYYSETDEVSYANFLYNSGLVGGMVSVVVKESFTEMELYELAYVSLSKATDKTFAGHCQSAVADVLMHSNEDPLTALHGTSWGDGFKVGVELSTAR